MDCLCRPSRIMTVRINLLDETDFIHEIKDDLPGQALLDVIFARLNLIETSYFGIRYIDEENQTHWLEPASRISRQLKPKSDPYDLYFGVKFYAADPCKLLEEITRYQLFLQVKQDVLQGRLPVPFELAAELGAFVVQSELGDYDQRRHSKGYVSEFRLLPQQSSELEQRVAELHQQLKGMSPAQAEMNYLDKVKWHDMYGVDLHPVLGEDSVEYFLGLTPSGIIVLRNKTTVAHYYWPRIAKVYYKGRYFMLRISDKNNELSTYGFETPRKPACKHLWRCCVEHHAFFRAVRIAPLPNSQSNTSDLFQLGSRLKYNSGRSEKQAAKDALNVGRAPPAFTRVPSKRQPRRVIDDILNGGTKRGPDAGYDVGAPLLEKHSGIKANTLTNAYESPYRSTYSIPTSLGIRPYSQQQSYQQQQTSTNGGNSNLQTPDSPRSTRSAPWPRSQQRSLFGNNPSSPRSVRSASTTGGSLNHHHHHHHHHHSQHQHHSQQQRHQQSSSQSSYHNQQQQRDHVPTHQQQRYRSSSVESHSSNDSRSTRRHKHRRRTSDNESELSRGSGRSGRSHHRKHRRNHRHRRDSVGSDRESSRGRSYSGHRTSSARSGSGELIDSTSQWREVQRRQAEASLGLSSVQQASVSKSSMVARSLHSNDSHSDTHSHHKSRRHRKNKSPSDSRNRMWNSELAKHLQFDLVDTAGMTEDQLREIPYTVVETTSKRSTSNLKIHKSNSKNSVGGKSTGSGNTITNGSNGTKEHGKNRVDRIRGLYFQNSNPSDSTGAKNGSIRSASTISSRECERNTGLVRMMSSMSMGDFISPTGSNLSPLENSTLRVSHEHTDSGLGADQDYAYSSERSSDSTRYGTNKSSGASSGSHRKCAGPGNSSTYNSLMQQTVSSQQQQQQQKQFQNHHQQQQQQQPYFSQRQNSQKHNYKYSSSQQQHQQQQTNPQTNQTQTSLAPIHNSHSLFTASNNSTNNNSINSNPNNGNGNEKGQHKASNNSNSIGNRLLNYTTFENNQYKFSLNNAFRRTGSQSGVSSLSCGGGNNSGGSGIGVGIGSLSALRSNNQMDNFVEWPNTPSAPYYYNGPSSTTAIKKRDAKSDIGVPTRRFSGQAMTKTQLLSGQLANASCYPMPAPAYPGIGFDSRLHPAKSDLFLSYLHTTPMYDGERRYIYNYQMPQMPDFLSNTSEQQQQQRHQPQQPSTTAYHISGVQTADPPPPPSLSGGSAGSSNSSSLLYGGATPATDVLYYQFDNGKCKSPPIVHQPKSLLNKTTGDATTMSQLPQVGPLVYLQHGQNVAAVNSQQTTCTTNSTNSTNSHSHSTCSEEDIDECDEDDIDETTDEGAMQHEQTSDDMQQFKMTETIKSIMATTPNNNSSNSIQLLSPTSNNTNVKETQPADSVTTTEAPTSSSIHANINLDNCNANVNVNLVNGNGNNWYATTATTTRNISTAALTSTSTNQNANSNISSTATSTTNINCNINTLNANLQPNSNQFSNQNQSQNQNQNQYQTENHNQNQNQNRNRPSHVNSMNSMNSIEQQNRNISSSLEIILSPIIQSSRRAQLLEK